MSVQKIIDNHYMTKLSMNMAQDQITYDEAAIKLKKYEAALEENGSDEALNYLTSPIDDLFSLTSMGQCGE